MNPERCQSILDLGTNGPHRLYRTCLLTAGHPGNHDYGQSVLSNTVPSVRRDVLTPGQILAMNSGIFLANLCIFVVILIRA